MIQNIELFSRGLSKDFVKALKKSRGKNRISTFYEWHKLEDLVDCRREIAKSYRSGRMNTSFQSFNNGLTHYWHYHTAHCPISYLGVAAGIMSCEQAGKLPSGRSFGVDFKEGYTIFEVWRHTKGVGLIPKDDPIPHSALICYAMSRGVCKRDDLIFDSMGWRLSDLHNKLALTVAEKEGINLGRQ